MALNRIGQISLALNQAGLDSSFYTLARGWENFVRKKLSEENDYKFYNKLGTVTSFISGQTNYTLPVDFQRADTCYRLNADGITRGAPIFLLEPYQFDYSQRASSGEPNNAMIDETAKTINFDNTPGSNTTTKFQLRYYFTPAVYATDSSDDTIITDFPAQNVVIQELIKMAYQHQEDDREKDQAIEAMKANQAQQRNSFEVTDTGQVDLSHAFYKMRRRR